VIVLVTGGASSGKSAYAEQVACSLAAPHVYLATMEPAGSEAAARIERHRALRAGKGFATVERARDLGSCQLPAELAGGTVLLEDLGNLVANTLFSPDSAGEAGADVAPEEVAGRLAEDVFSLADQCRNLVVVGNEVGCDGVRYDGATQGYVRAVGALACVLAQRADYVVECVAGIPVVVKPEGGMVL